MLRGIIANICHFKTFFLSF